MLESIIQLGILFLFFTFLALKGPDIVRSFKEYKISWNRAFEQLIQKKMIEIGALFGRNKSTYGAEKKQKNKKEQNSNNAIYPFYKKMKELERDKKNNSKEYLQLKKITQFLELAYKSNQLEFKFLSEEINKKYRINCPAARICFNTNELLNAGVLFKDRDGDAFYSFLEIKQIIKTFTILDLLVEDVEKERSEVSSILEKKKNIKRNYIYEAVEFLVLSKSGASEKNIIDDIVKNRFKGGIKIKSISSNLKFKAKVNLVLNRLGVVSVEDIFINIFNIVKKIDRARKSYIHQAHKDKDRRKSENYKSFNDKKAESESGRNRKRRSADSPLELLSAFNVIGCTKSDSDKTIKKKYKKLVLKKHPDIISSNLEEAEKKEVHDEFTQIQNAYELIKKYRKVA